MLRSQILLSLPTNLSLYSIKKYGDETGFDKPLNDKMFETPGDEAENFDEPSKWIAIPVHSSK